MRSNFAEWLDQMQHIADAENITVAARHYDFLDYQFVTKMTPTQAFMDYKLFLERWNAITKNGRFTESSGDVMPNCRHVCSACNMESHGVKSRKRLPHTCGK